MGRKPRIDFAGAFYHVITRRNRRAPLFHDVADYTAYLLRRAANESLNTVAVRFGVSASRISKIQDAIESTPFTPLQRQAMAQCAIKEGPE